VSPSSLLLYEQARHALGIAIALGLPAVIAAAIAGLLVAFVQSAFQIHETSLVTLARVLAVIATLALAGSWMGDKVRAFALTTFTTTVESQR
jgi:flagellar biosynthetic protein FliQ